MGGGGLVLLGAAFLCWVDAGLVVAAAVALLAAILQQTEIAVGMIWGTVAMRLISLRSRNWADWVGLAAGGLGTLWGGWHGGLGRFGGLALIVIGLIIAWERLRQAPQPTPKTRTGWRGWLGIILGTVAVGGGAWVLLGGVDVAAAMVGLPMGMFAVMIMAPCFAVATRLMRRRNVGGDWWLPTMGLGLCALVAGGCDVTVSTWQVVLPFVAVLALLQLIASKQKTARWWGGVAVALYVVMVIGLWW